MTTALELAKGYKEFLQLTVHGLELGICFPRWQSNGTDFNNLIKSDISMLLDNTSI